MSDSVVKIDTKKAGATAGVAIVSIIIAIIIYLIVAWAIYWFLDRYTRVRWNYWMVFLVLIIASIVVHLIALVSMKLFKVDSGSLMNIRY